MRLEKLLLFWNLMLFSILVQEMVQISVQRFFRWVVNCSSPTWTTSFSLSLAAKQDKTIMAEWLPELKTAILSAQQSLEDCKYVGGLDYGKCLITGEPHTIDDIVPIKTGKVWWYSSNIGCGFCTKSPLVVLYFSREANLQPKGFFTNIFMVR
ncbi:uncharacterized protein LOC106757846 isoform X1 [Vigna radiata var. radiata]|uniref:Uncharacterized protein LOC106757846 isoform X1 n=1 Tax=Vigna radiata var. radiata TaxID=3916 RepID=A0A1S3TQW1_VIGRR|nr:uncharacterized protein LOC106757846 isoform X1 [Vigna radiata var. radiata]XP_014496164.1 uncharacterized protein LOC106757846 isoform X1 [Vigna radiata var. radiata]